MDFDNILDIATQNQGGSNVQVRLSFTEISHVTRNNKPLGSIPSCHVLVLLPFVDQDQAKQSCMCFHSNNWDY